MQYVTAESERCSNRRMVEREGLVVELPDAVNKVA
jgi:hypothetical protein